MADGSLQGKRLLIVEDDTFLHTLLANKLTQLREKGVEVDPVLNAEEALKSVGEYVPDLIILDVVLPGMTGLEFLAKIRTQDNLKKVPVIILSNIGGDDEKARAKELGVAAYLVKADFSLEKISDGIEGILTGKQQTL